MKTPVAISSGPGKGEVGFINGDFRRLIGFGMVMVYFPNCKAPRDMRRIRVARLREANAAEVLLCSVCVPENQSATAEKVGKANTK